MLGKRGGSERRGFANVHYGFLLFWKGKKNHKGARHNENVIF
jgi:hypothetical protein